MSSRSHAGAANAVAVVEGTITMISQPMELKNMQVVFLEVEHALEETISSFHIMMHLAVFDRLQSLTEGIFIVVHNAKPFLFQAQQESSNSSSTEEEFWYLVDHEDQVQRLATDNIMDIPVIPSWSSNTKHEIVAFAPEEVTLDNLYIIKISSLGFVEISYSKPLSDGTISSGNDEKNRFRIFFTHCQRIALTRLFPHFHACNVLSKPIKSFKRLLLIPQQYYSQEKDALLLSNDSQITYFEFTIRSSVSFSPNNHDAGFIPTDIINSSLWKIPKSMRHRCVLFTVYVLQIRRELELCFPSIDNDMGKQRTLVDFYLSRTLSTLASSVSLNVSRDVSREFTSAWFCDWMCIRAGLHCDSVRSFIPLVISTPSLARVLKLHHLQCNDSLPGDKTRVSYSMHALFNLLSSSTNNDESNRHESIIINSCVQALSVENAFKECIFPFSKSASHVDNTKMTTTLACKMSVLPILGYISLQNVASNNVSKLQLLLRPGMSFSVTYLSSNNNQSLAEDMVYVQVNGLYAQSGSIAINNIINNNNTDTNNNVEAVQRFKRLLYNISSTSAANNNNIFVVASIQFPSSALQTSSNKSSIFLRSSYGSLDATSFLLSLSHKLQLIVHNYDTISTVSHSLPEAEMVARQTMTTISSFNQQFMKKGDSYVDPIASLLLKRSFSIIENDDEMYHTGNNFTQNIPFKKPCTTENNVNQKQQIMSYSSLLLENNRSIQHCLLQFHQVRRDSLASTMTLSYPLTVVLLKVQIVSDFYNEKTLQTNPFHSFSTSVNANSKMCLWVKDIMSCDILRLYLPFYNHNTDYAENDRCSLLWIPLSVLQFPAGLVLTVSKNQKLYAHYPQLSQYQHQYRSKKPAVLFNLEEEVKCLGMSLPASVRPDALFQFCTFNNAYDNNSNNNSSNITHNNQQEEDNNLSSSDIFRNTVISQVVFSSLFHHFQDTFAILQSEYLQKSLLGGGKRGLLTDEMLLQTSPVITSLRAFLLSLVPSKHLNKTRPNVEYCTGVFYTLIAQITRLRRLSVTCHCPHCFKVLQLTQNTQYAPYTPAILGKTAANSLRCKHCATVCVLPNQLNPDITLTNNSNSHNSIGNVRSAEVVWSCTCLVDDGSSDGTVKIEGKGLLECLLLQPVLHAIHQISLNNTNSYDKTVRQLQLDWYDLVQSLWKQIQAILLLSLEKINIMLPEQEIIRLDVDLSDNSFTNHNDDENEYDNEDYEDIVDRYPGSKTNEEDMDFWLFSEQSKEEKEKLKKDEEEQNNLFLYSNEDHSLEMFLRKKVTHLRLLCHQLQCMTRHMSNVTSNNSSNNHNAKKLFMSLRRWMTTTFSDIFAPVVMQQPFRFVVSVPLAQTACFSPLSSQSNNNNTSFNINNIESSGNSKHASKEIFLPLKIQEDNRTNGFAYRCQTTMFPSQCILYSNKTTAYSGSANNNRSSNDHKSINSNDNVKQRPWQSMKCEFIVHTLACLHTKTKPSTKPRGHETGDDLLKFIAETLSRIN